MKKIIKKILPRSLFARSLLILITPVFLIQIITSFIFFDRHWEKMTDRLAYAVAGEVAIISSYLESGLDPAERKAMITQLSQSLDLLVSFTPDRTLANSEMDQAIETRSESIVGDTLRAALKDQVRRPFDVTVAIHEKWVRVRVELSNGLLQVDMPQRRLFSSSGYVFLLWVTGSSLVLLAIAVLFMRNQVRPIRRLAIVAERLGRGLSVPPSFKPEGAREVRQAARAFLDMHERIGRQVQQRTGMLAGISHDLRTPVTRMKLQLSMMDPSADTLAIKGDLEEMERMLNAYLDFARGEGGESPERTDISSLLNTIIFRLRRQSVPIETDIAPDLTMQVKPLAIERAVSNILSNARKYGDQIRLMAKMDPEDKELMIVVEDNGPGVAADLREDMFRPFVRGEPSRNANTGGVGLGLPIAQDIIHGHGGTIALGDSETGGLKVEIRLPA